MRWPTQPLSSPRRPAGFTLVEMMVAVGLASLLVAILMALYVSGLRSFAAMANYQNLDAKSCSTLDILSREIRNSTLLVSYVTNQSLTFSNATARGGLGQVNLLIYDAAAKTLVLKRTGQADMTNLTECDSWGFTLYSRAPDTNSFGTNIVFYTTTAAASCKLVNLTWKCSRSVLGSKLNTESVQSAQIVLRNKVN